MTSDLSPSASAATPTQDPSLPSPAAQEGGRGGAVPVRGRVEDDGAVECLREKVRRLETELAAERDAKMADRKRLEEVVAGGSGSKALDTPPSMNSGEKTIQMGSEGTERNIRAGPSGGLLPGAVEEGGELNELTKQLKVFCQEAQKFSV